MFRGKQPLEKVARCPGCGAPHSTANLKERLYICPSCARYLPMPSRARIEMLADPRTFRELDRKLVSVDPLKFTDRQSYRERLKQARREAGVLEAVTTGVCQIEGQRTVLVVFDFEFLGGTMGSTVGEKVARAFEFATKRRLPLVSVTASGGARVQEGMLSLLQMAKVAAAASAHNRKGLAFISILTDPTFGGVTASFASLGDVLISEPGAHIGFVGPRVVEQTTGNPSAEGSHGDETVLRAGLIDMVVARPALRDTIGHLVRHLRRRQTEKIRVEKLPPKQKTPKLAAWEEVLLARHAGRPTARQCIARMTAHFVELHGDRQSGDDPAIVGGVAELDGHTVIIIGQERENESPNREASHGGIARPEGYRKSLRLMRLATKFRIPVVTLVDCPGTPSGSESEQFELAQSLATNLATMAGLPTPIVSVVIGEGGSGGALALAVADRILMLEHAIYSVISPEGAAAILYRDAGKADKLAEGLKLTARGLLKLGLIDAVVPEPQGGAHLDPASSATALKTHILAALRKVSRVSRRRLLARRYEKYRRIGKVGVYWREALRGEMRDGLSAFARLFHRAEGY